MRKLISWTMATALLTFLLALSLSRESRAAPLAQTPSGAWVLPVTDYYFEDEAQTKLYLRVTRQDHMALGYSTIKIEIPDPESANVLYALEVKVKQWYDQQTAAWKYEARSTIGGKEKVTSGTYPEAEEPLNLAEMAGIAALAVVKKYDRIRAIAKTDSRKFSTIIAQIEDWDPFYPGTVEIPGGTCYRPPPTTNTISCQDPLPTFVDLPNRYSDDKCWGADSMCSNGAPVLWAALGWLYGDPFGLCQIPWHLCCLEHDRAFYCGGTCAEQNNANAALVGCWAGTYALCGAYTLYAGGRGWFLLGAFWSIFLVANNADCISNDDKQGLDGWINSDGTDGQDEVDTACARAETCFCPDRMIDGQWCGGDEPVVLCDNPQCLLNDCSTPEPFRYNRWEWDDQGNCNPPNQSAEQCRGKCVETYDANGVLQSRQWQTQKRLVYSDGQRSEWFDADCTPSVPCPDCPDFHMMTALEIGGNITINLASVGTASTASSSSTGDNVNNAYGLLIGLSANDSLTASIPHLGGSSTAFCAPAEFHDDLTVEPLQEPLGGPVGQGFKAFEPNTLSAVAYSNGKGVRHEVFARDVRGYLYQRRCLGTGEACTEWSDWTNMGAPHTGTGAVAVTQWFSSDFKALTVSIVERRKNKRLYRRDFTSKDGGATGTWSAWTQLDSPDAAGSPTAVAWRDAKNALHHALFFKDSSGALWRAACDGSPGNDACSYGFGLLAPNGGGDAAHAGDPVATAQLQDDDEWRIDLFIRRADDAIQRKTQIGSPGGPWSDWEAPSGSITGAPFVDNPNVISWRDQFDRSRIHVYAKDAQKNLWVRNWDSEFGWNQWTQIAQLGPQ